MSGTLDLLSGLLAFTPITVVNPVSPYTIPQGATNVIIEIWGGGGAGYSYQSPGGGGGAGAYVRSSYPCAGGQKIYFLNAASGGAPNPSGGIGGAGGDLSVNAALTTIPSFVAMLAQGGRGGQGVTTPGIGGSASGGNQANINGPAGQIPFGAIGIPGTIFGDGSPYGGVAPVAQAQLIQALLAQ